MRIDDTEMAAASLELPEAEFLRRKLRIELVSARVEAERTQKTMAKELDWSLSKVARIEQGVGGVAPSDVRAMLSLFGASEDRIEELVALARTAREAKSWAEYDDILSPAYRELIGQEAAALSIHKYEPAVVPGLFQTREYTLALLSSQGASRDSAIRQAEVRGRRQAILEHEDGPEITVVLGEIALARPAGNSEVMRGQISHLMSVSNHPRVSLFLMPFAAGSHRGMGIPFTILEFLDPSLDDVLYLEDANKRTTSNEEREVVQQYHETFQVIQEMAEEAGEIEDHLKRSLEVYAGEDR